MDARTPAAWGVEAVWLRASVAVRPVWALSPTCTRLRRTHSQVFRQASGAAPAR